MKKLLILFSLLVGLFFSSQAQKISLPGADFKKDMSGAFSPDDELGFDSNKKGELKSANDKFFDDVLKIAGSGDSDEKKKKDLLDLGKKQSGVFSTILGEDNAKKYKKNIKKKIRPFKTKYKLATLIL